MLLTAVAASREEALQLYLRDLEPGAFRGRLPPTHFARFVVIEMDEGPKLLFSSRFDGDARPYLEALSRTDEAAEIWGHCAIPGDMPLERYLCDEANHVTTQYVVSAFHERLRVGEINSALRLRGELSRFAAKAESAEHFTLWHEFRQLKEVRRILAR
jgi:hypothetical protein